MSSSTKTDNRKKNILIYDEIRLVEIASAKNENKHKCSSCTLYAVLISICFTNNVGISSYFLCFQWYLKKDAIRVKFGTRTKIKT